MEKELGQRSRALVLVALLVLSALVVGCRRSAVPPLRSSPLMRRCRLPFRRLRENTDQVGQMGSGGDLTTEGEPVLTLEPA